jgi:signal transduction histidine kinase
MRYYSDGPQRAQVFGLQKKHWKVAVLLGISYLLCMWFSERFIPHPATLFPASAVAVSALFLVGIELWPIVYLAAFIGSYASGFPLIFLLIVPIAQTVQAIAGAVLMREAKIDPLFRRSRDIFLLIGIIFLTSLIVPTLETLTALISSDVFKTHYLLAPWSLRYVGTVLCLLVITPFLLRWFAKRYFNRTWLEIIETVLVFLLLIAIDAALFIYGIQLIFGVPMVYFLLAPLFWIALRLRPRFVTLSLLITTIFAISSFYVGGAIPPASEFTTRLFQLEEFLIVLSMMFFIIVSLEEDRRLSANLLRSQVATLENAVARISSESSAKNDFIAVLAHELRNPLAPVVTAIDVLKMRKDLDQEGLETLSMMEGRMNTVRRLLDDLLDISRISEGKIALKVERINLEVVLKRAILSTDHHLKDRHQLFTFRGLNEELFIQGDPVRIEQIFSNLLTNASKYSDPGDQIMLSISKVQGPDGREYAEIAVSDTGIGIDSAVIEDIFTPFLQVELGARTKKGLGIGLALARSFVEMHDGTIIATSEGIGKGSTFSVRLPLSSEESVLESRPSKPSAVETEETGFAEQLVEDMRRGPTVLVVDDNDAAAWSMGKLLLNLKDAASHTRTTAAKL